MSKTKIISLITNWNYSLNFDALLFKCPFKHFKKKSSQNPMCQWKYFDLIVTFEPTTLNRTRYKTPSNMHPPLPRHFSVLRSLSARVFIPTLFKCIRVHHFSLSFSFFLFSLSLFSFLHIWLEVLKRKCIGETGSTHWSKVTPCYSCKGRRLGFQIQLLPFCSTGCQSQAVRFYK